MRPAETQSNTKKYLFHALRGVAIFVLMLIVKTATNIQVISLSQNEDIIRGQSGSSVMAVFFAVAAFGVWLIYGTVTYVLALYDTDSAERFFERHVSEVKFIKEAPHVLRSPEFLLETGVSILISLIGGMVGCFFETERFLGLLGLENPALRILLAELINLPVLIFISLFQRCEVRHRWHDLRRIGDTDQLRSPLRMGLRFASLLLYPLVYPYAMLPVYMTLTLTGIATEFAKAFGLLGFGIVGVILLILLCGIPLWKRRRAKIRFLRRLAAVAEENGYIFTNVTATGSDAARRPQFSLEKDGRVFYFRFLDTLRRGTPLYFTSETQAHFLHRIGTKKHNIALAHNFEYGFEAEGGDKLLVIIRYPKRVYASSDNATRPLVGGDRIWGYTVFEPDTLIAHVDRKCLGRYSGMFE